MRHEKKIALALAVLAVLNILGILYADANHVFTPFFEQLVGE